MQETLVKKKKEVKRWTPDASCYPNGVLDPFFSISLISLTQITIIQLKNLTKTIKKIHNSDCILERERERERERNYFTYKDTKKSYVIGETKAKFFTTTVN